jgi:hypothetical protein
LTSTMTSFLATGGMSHTWIDADDVEETEVGGSGGGGVGMGPEANLSRSSRAWERVSSWCLETIIVDLGHSKFTYNYLVNQILVLRIILIEQTLTMTNI